MPEPAIRILAIAPYEAMRVSLEHLADTLGPRVSLRAVTGDLEEGVAVVKNTPPTECDCIISRGGTAQLIRGITDIPVVEIGVSVYDVLRTINLAENYSDKYAIVGFPNITEPAHILCDLLRYDVDILTVRSAAEVEHTLSRLREGGYRLVVCDMSSHRAALRMDFDAFLITSGEESLRSALDLAIETGRNFRALREESFFLREGLADSLRLAVLTQAGELHFSWPSQPSGTALRVLTRHLPELTGDPVRFYHNENGRLFQITAHLVTLGAQTYGLFGYTETSIPAKTSRAGLRFLSLRECEALNGDSLPVVGKYGPIAADLGAAAASCQSVFLVGEPGTGKAELARLLYLRSPLKNKPFVSVDCAVLNAKSWEYLLESYASPLNDASGTVFFDHLEKLSENTAGTLLTAIRETGMHRRLRLIFSCCRPEGAPVPEPCRPFAQSLGLPVISIPALRTRPDEIPPLANLLLSGLNLELGRQISGFDPKALERLRDYRWPQNILQFQRVIRELALSTTSPYISASSVTELLTRERSLWEGEPRARPPYRPDAGRARHKDCVADPGRPQRQPLRRRPGAGHLPLHPLALSEQRHPVTPAPPHTILCPTLFRRHILSFNCPLLLYNFLLFFYLSFFCGDWII